jgi:hypothetical protein
MVFLQGVAYRIRPLRSELSSCLLAPRKAEQPEWASGMSYT